LATGVGDWLEMNDVVIKFLANMLVIMLNYVASKWGFSESKTDKKYGGMK
jgi:hypothetical protein